MNRTVSFLVALAAVISVSPARADNQEKLACIDAHEKAQLLRSRQALREARAELLVCSRDSCPTLIRRECAPWLVEVAANTPSVLLVAKWADGSDLTEVRVWIDGASLAEKVDSHAIELDPGEHRLRFELAGSEAIERTIELRPGEKNRRVEATFQRPKHATSRRHDSGTSRPRITHMRLEPRPNHTAAYIAGGVSVVALGSFGFFALRGRKLESDRADSCAPSCDAADVQPVRTSYTVADVSLGVAVVSAAVATYLFVRDGASSQTGFRRAPTSALVRF